MNSKKIFYPVKKSEGFIFVEVIVSITILMLAIPAALTIASKSVFLASYAKDQVIATYLAEEGIEIIRNRRDQNMLQIEQGSGISWNDRFFSGANNCKSPNKCIVDYGTGSSDSRIENCVGACTFVLNKDSNSGTYSYFTGPTWSPSAFSRYVQTNDISVLGDGTEIQVTSVVTYHNKTVTLTDNLTPWIQ